MVRTSSVVLIAIIAMVSACRGGPSPGVPATAPTAVSAAPVEQPRQPTRILGKVTDRAGQPLSGALVEILDGAEAGTTAVTDDSGRYDINVSTTNPDRSVTIRASRNGYQPRITQAWRYAADTAKPEQVIWLDTGPAIVFNPGAYTVTIAFDVDRSQSWLPQAPCAGFPPAFSVRSYEATVRADHTGRDNSFRLVDVGRFSALGGFGLTIVGRFVEFEFDYPIEEGVPPSGYLAITGLAPTMEPAIVSGASLSIPFHGWFNYYPRTPDMVDRLACSSEQAVMTFTPR